MVETCQVQDTILRPAGTHILLLVETCKIQFRHRLSKWIKCTTQARDGTYFSPVGVPEMEVFLELGRDVLILRLGSCTS